MKHLIRNTEQVQALLNGATQLRIPVNKDWIQSSKEPLQTHSGIWHFYNSGEHEAPFQVGDEVFVKEKFVISLEDGHEAESEQNPLTTYYSTDNIGDCWVDQDEEPCNIPWKPSVHMTEEESRFTLKITNVRVERLQDSLNFEDMFKIGIPKDFKCDEDGLFLYEWFEDFWDSSAKDGFTYDDNPYVFVYDFEIVKSNK